MRTADKTTYQDLSSTSAAGVNALLDAKTQSRKADLQRRLNDAIRNSAPPIGQYWKGQGGIYAGIIRDGDRQWHLILAAELVNPEAENSKPRSSTIEAEWGTYGATIPGEFSRRDGQHNTALILAAEPNNKIAVHFTALLIDGHKDFYWPSQCENNLLFANLPEHLSQEWHWGSTQYSARSAWHQRFEDGYQRIFSKDCSLAARAVRRLPI